MGGGVHGLHRDTHPHRTPRTGAAASPRLAGWRLHEGIEWMDGRKDWWAGRGREGE